MNLRKKLLIPLALVTATAAALPFAAQAMDGGPHCDGHGPRFGMRGGMNHFEGGMHMPPFIRELKLTEAQRDQIFKIMHEQAPAIRDKAKEARKAHADLRALTFSGNYDEAKVKALAETEAQAMAAITQLRAAGANQIYQLLTPEQRKKADELKAQFEADGPRRAGPPPADGPAAGKRR
ncbi:Spy/CpxP family protein refolding chaperone [uncultured Zoogloea sp.]|uniref:Spy/CpxP family protein refolding chaperone n=1 Tax=uncultured Zoogloea sp. TaxID=160237 RepID=UPI00261169D7|nr:Spy/CpxP family protein refolding chaperone [uncultured Zoogloea sp.]